MHLQDYRLKYVFFLNVVIQREKICWSKAVQVRFDYIMFGVWTENV